jgi:L-arabinokinase
LLVAYVSGHGYGHATRTAEVLRAVRERSPGMPLAVVTAGPERLYRKAIPGPFLFRSLVCDVGLAQKGALVIDEAATARRWREFAARRKELAADEAGWLRDSSARLVLGDVPPLAFEAAAEAGVPAVALANFSWDWVYRHLAGRQPALLEAAEAAASAYGTASLLLQLPFAGDLSAFPQREPIPLVARRPRMGREEARRRLGVPETRACVLVSFGGIAMPAFDPAVLAGLAGFHFLMDAREGSLPANLTAVDAARLEALGMGYQDLVRAADVVVTKPGYGIVSDAIAAGTRIVYTERGDFPEYPILVAEMPRYVPCAHVGNEDLLAGRWQDAIESVLAQPVPPPPDLGGAESAARRLVGLAGRAIAGGD